MLKCRAAEEQPRMGAKGVPGSKQNRILTADCADDADDRIGMTDQIF